MKRKVIIKKAIAVAVTMSLMTCLVPNGSITVNAASKKSMLSKTKISVNVGKKKTVKLKKAKYKVVWKIISGKKNISIKKKGKYKQKIQIKGKNIGKAKIKAVYGKRKYILKVTVKGNNKENITKNVETPKNIETTSKTTVQTTEKASTVSTTEARVTTVPTTVEPTTVMPTTMAPTTVVPTTVASTTVMPTTAIPTTVMPTTTVAPTTVASTTVMPTTMAPTTVVPTTVTPTTSMPITMAPTTVVLTTVAPATVTPTTVTPTTVASTTAPIIPDMEVDENIKAPEGLVWAGNKELPYYFAWAKASDVDSYNVYVDGKCIKNVVDGAVNLDASVFEKGSGEYTISVAAVKGNKISVATSLKYTFSPDGQLVTTESEKVTNKPTDATTVKTTTTVMPTTIATTEIQTTIAPTAPSQEVDENIKAPEGLVWAGNKELPYYFAWAATDGADSYNVYVDNKYVTNVEVSSVNLDKSVFEKGSGEYTISVAAVKGNKKSNSTSIKYTYNKEGQHVTTVAPTEKITEVTTTTQKEFYEEPETEVHPKNINVDNYMRQIDTSSSTSIKTSANEGMEKLFDGDINTKLCTSDGFPLRISWQMKKPIILKKYTLTTANDSETYSYRNPKSWHLYGSNNGTSWTQIDTVTDSGIEAKNSKSYTYETDIQESYQYYLIQFEGNGTNYYGFQLAEISLNGDVADVDKEMGEDLSSYYDSIFASATTAKGNGDETPFNLFDGRKESKLFEFSNQFSIAWKMKQDTTLYSYSLTTANDNEAYKGRNPKSWILYGSSDGTNWEKIDTVNNSGMEDVNFKTYNYTVDKVGSYRYYKLDVKAGYGSSVQLSEISLKGAYISPSKYDILFTGDWKDVTVDGYLEELTKLFYNSYPRLYQRWGNGTEPTTITFKADNNYDGVAYCQGTTVCVSTKYANSHPKDIGFFSHEITHSVQQYSGKLNYGDDVAWWTENMANYGGFRYFHWSNPKYVQVYEATDTSLQDWGYEQYGNNKWFFAYMDSKYPTRKNADGTLKYGLIDSINKLIKDNNTGSTYTDDPYNTTTPFNNVVKQITGYDCIESLRKRYVEELQQGTWTFKGFADYEDNWLTENIDGIPNPEYPMVGEKLHGNKTATQLNNTVTEGTNLCLGGKVYDCSGYTNDNENAQKLIDGDLNTKWCATSSNVTSGEYKLNGVKHWVKIDLGKEKEFNTYTLYNTRSKEGFGNTTEWEVLVSNDGNEWTSVDYQPSNNSAISSFNIGNQKARYIMIKIFTPDDGVGTLRLYDFQLFNIK
ncbi:discoidin domain-containing protein [Eubacterium ventriosum]|uniref:discoidin domain-containing protein n=1 Tax=Eubacterium ventriosum TaxID=39496 RepID=UPI0026728C7B|nr:discoidin domain-containing protein [Eubacterium ventriosum]